MNALKRLILAGAGCCVAGLFPLFASEREVIDYLLPLGIYVRPRCGMAKRDALFASGRYPYFAGE